MKMSAMPLAPAGPVRSLHRAPVDYRRSGEKRSKGAGAGGLSPPADSAVLLQVNRDLVDLAGEAEGRLVGEVHGRADVLADVEPFADRDLQRNGFWQLAFGDLAAVHRHGHGAALAE